MISLTNDLTSANQSFRVAVLVSGNGSNLQVLIDQQLQEKLPINIVGVISNKADAYALQRAEKANIATAIFEKDNHGKRLTRQGFETLALDQLHAWQPDLIVLAGFMQILTPMFINGVPCPMINLHPSLLPLYKGLDTHARVLQTGETYHGCSVHIVTADLDAGEVVAQAITKVNQHDNVDTLTNRVHQLEHQLLPMVVGWFARGLIGLENQQLVNHFNINLPAKFYW